MIPIGLHARQTCQPSHRGRQSDFYGCGKVHSTGHEPLMKSRREVTIPGRVNDN